MTNFQVQKGLQLIKVNYRGEAILPLTHKLGPGQVYLETIWQDVGQKVPDGQEGLIRLKKFRKIHPTHTYRLIQIIDDE